MFGRVNKEIEELKQSCENWADSYSEKRRALQAANNQIHDLLLRVHDLEVKNAELIKQLTEVKKPSADVQVCFTSMNVISVERMPDGRTIIGYLRPDQTFGEWTLNCDLENHNRLVSEFREYLSHRKKTQSDKSINKREDPPLEPSPYP